ncbi:MAG: hypothetical protein U0168_18690 [Nannocystaceae bacterium]
MQALWLAWSLAADPPALIIHDDHGCLQPQSLLDRMAAWSGVGARTWPTGATVVVEHRDGSLRIVAQRGAATPIERTFHAPPTQCADLELAAAVAIAMALDGLPDPIPASSATAPATATATAPAPAPAPAPAAAPTRDRNRPPQWSASATASAGVAALPFTTGGAALALTASWRRVAAIAELGVHARVVARAGGTTGSLHLAHPSLALGACAPRSTRRSVLQLCGLVLGGPLWVAARDTAAGRADAVAQLAAVLRTQAMWSVSPRWSLGLGSDVVFTLVRPSIAASRAGTPLRWRTPPVGWRGGLVIGVRLGAMKRGAAARMQGRT